MICDKTTHWAFTTRLTNLATNTTLAGATRHDFAAITIHTPEASGAGSGFAIKSAFVVLTIRDAFTVATDIDGVRIGIKLGAVAFDDVDQIYSAAHSNDHETITVQRDVTNYFQTNYGMVTSQTCQVGVAVATGVAANVNNITCELFLTYDYDNGASATHCKTVEIPIQGHHQLLTTASVELGTLGTSPAPASQIPQLTGGGLAFLVEAGITIRQLYLRLTATDGGNAATDFNLFVQIDGGVELTRATLEQALISCAAFKDVVDLAAYGMPTTAAHALNCRSSLDNTFQNLSAVLVVTYTFDASTTARETHSVRLPLVSERGNLSPHNPSTTAADDDLLSATLDIQDGAPVALLQSGIVIEDNVNSGAALTVYAPGQGERVFGHSGFTYTSGAQVVRRCDHDSSSWMLDNGPNRLSVAMRLAGSSTQMTFSAYAIVNYQDDDPASGVGAGNRTVMYPITDHQAEATIHYVTQTTVPSFPAVPWKLSGEPFLHYMPRGDFRTNACVVGAERGAGEDSGDGWVQQLCTFGSGNVKATRRSMIVPTDWFKRSSNDARPALDITSARRWKSTTSITHSWLGYLCYTLHSHAFTVSGTLTIGGTPAPNGKAIKVWAYLPSNEIELIGLTFTAGGAGGFAMSVPDRTRTYFATHQDGSDNGASHAADLSLALSGFDITIGGAGGSGGNTYSKSRVVNL